VGFVVDWRLDLLPRARGFGLLVTVMTASVRVVLSDFLVAWAASRTGPSRSSARVGGRGAVVCVCAGMFRGMAVRRAWSDVVARITDDCVGIGGVRRCCSGRGPMSYVGHVYC